MKILHLSDLHLNPFYHKSNYKKTKAVIEKALDKSFNHFVITGDIAHDADKESFKLFRNILKEFNLLDAKKTSITIGNHDIFGGVYSVKDLLNFPQKCINTNFDKMVKNYINYFEELFVDCYMPSNNNIFPYAKNLDNYVLIGLNTNDIYSKLKNPFASNGKLSEEEFEDLKIMLELPQYKNKNKIILAHHHFYKNNYEAKSSSSDLWNKIEGFTLKLRGKKKLIKLFAKNNVAVVLHGHSHENKIYKRKGILFCNSGGSIDNENISLATVNMLEVNPFQIDYTIEQISMEENTFSEINFVNETLAI